MFDWKEKRVLVTGASGFLGSWLTEHLVERGADVSVLVKPDCPRAECMKTFSDKVTEIRGDLRSFDAINTAVKEKDMVFHLAALTQVIYSIKNPAETMEVNFNGTINILEALRRSPTPAKLFYMSTDKVYGEPDKLPIDETNTLSAKSPYDASKLAADRAAYSYYKTYGLPVSILRCSNIYGGRDANILRAVPDFVRAVLNKKKPVIRGTGKHQRDYIYIDDVVKAIALIMENPKKTEGEVFTVGTGVPTSVYDLAEAVIKASGFSGSPKVLSKETVGEIDRQYISYEKINRELGWKPETGLADGLKRTLDWYGKNPWIFDVIDRVEAYYSA